MSENHKWSEDYVQHGFTCLTESDGTERQQSILCSKVLSNANLKPSRLNEHFDNCHGGAKSKNDLNTLKIETARFRPSGTLENHGFVPIDKPLLHMHTSCKVAFFVCQKKEAVHSIRRVSETLSREMAKPVQGVAPEKSQV